MTPISGEPSWRRLRSWATLGGTMSRAARRRSSLVLLGLPLVLAGCISDDSRPLNIFNPEGPEAHRINQLHPYVFGIAAVILVLVVGAVIYVGFNNKVNIDEYDPNDLPDQVHGNLRLEIGWTILPAIILAGLAAPTVATWWALERRDPEALQVMVIGQQWWWEYRYDIDGDGFFDEPIAAGEVQHSAAPFDQDDLVVANELVIPAGQRVDLTITSRDIIHSFWIPRLNGKRDAVPGRFHPWTITAEEPGKFVGWCTEFCGLSHARMRMSTIALPPDEWEEWLANQLDDAEVIDEPADATADTPEAAAFRGQQLFAAQCASCHRIRSDAFEYPEDFEAVQISGAAPDLTHLATRTVHAGAIYTNYLGIDANDNDYDPVDYLDLQGNWTFNTPGLKAWVSNAPALKAMAPQDDRGMPSFEALSDQDLDDVVAYLATLD